MIPMKKCVYKYLHFYKLKSSSTHPKVNKRKELDQTLEILSTQSSTKIKKKVHEYERSHEIHSNKKLPFPF